MSLWACLLGNSSYRISSKLLRKQYFPFKSLPVQPWGLCFSETLRICKLALLGVFRLGWIWCNFCRDSKRHLSYMRLSLCQISHHCSKVQRRASSLANYLQVLITWPNQFISPPPYFLREPNLFIWTFKEKEISCRQTHDMENFSSNCLSLAKLQAVDNSPVPRRARQAQGQAGLPAPPAAWPATHGRSRRSMPSPRQLFLRSQEKWFVASIVCGLIKRGGWNIRKHSRTTRELHSRGRWIKTTDL